MRREAEVGFLFQRNTMAASHLERGLQLPSTDLLHHHDVSMGEERASPANKLLSTLSLTQAGKELLRSEPVFFGGGAGLVFCFKPTPCHLSHLSKDKG